MTDNESQTGLDHRDAGVRYGHDLPWPLLNLSSPYGAIFNHYKLKCYPILGVAGAEERDVCAHGIPNVYIF